MNTLEALRYINQQIPEIREIALNFNGQQVGFKFQDGRPGYYKIMGESIPVDVKQIDVESMIDELNRYLKSGTVSYWGSE